MFNKILELLGSELEQNVLRSFEGTGFDTVRLLNLKKGEDRLLSNALNVVLFSTKAERDLMGISTYSVPTTGEDGLMQKPPLKLSVDILFIFNYSNYDIALSIYSQVLGYFYNNDLINVPFDGYPNEVQILLSSFNDRDEIELWNAFNMAGTPVLRYELQHLMISGKTEELPYIKKIALSGSTLDPENAGMDPIILNMVYYPIEGYLNGITQKANTFCSYQGTGPELDKRYDELIASFDIAYAQTEQLLIQLGGDSIASPTALDQIDQFYPFYPAIKGIMEEIITDRDEVKDAGKDDPELCTLLKTMTQGEDSLTASLLKRLTKSTEYEGITNSLNEAILKFNVLGESAYGEMPIHSDNPKDLSMLQLRTKWWKLGNLLHQLHKDYQDTQENPLLDFPAIPAYRNFIDLLKECEDQLVKPIAEFTLLNERYNSQEGEPITNRALRQYKEAYEESWRAVNLLNTQVISLLLIESMERILEEQNSKQ